ERARAACGVEILVSHCRVTTRSDTDRGLAPARGDGQKKKESSNHRDKTSERVHRVLHAPDNPANNEGTAKSIDHCDFIIRLHPQVSAPAAPATQHPSAPAAGSRDVGPEAHPPSSV